jgi:hypothetical protein
MNSISARVSCGPSHFNLEIIVSRTNFTSYIAVESREDKVTVAELISPAIAQDQIAKPLRHSRSLLPSDSIFVFLAGRAIRCANGVQLEERVVREEENESLADGTGGAQDTCLAVSSYFMGDMN